MSEQLPELNSLNIEFEHVNRLWFIITSSRLQMFFKLCVLKNFIFFTGNHLCWSLFLIKLQTFRRAALLRKRLQHKCFLVNIAKFLRTASGWIMVKVPHKLEGFLVLECQCRGFSVLESRCRGLNFSISRCRGVLVPESRFLVFVSRYRFFFVLEPRCRGMCVSTASFSFSSWKQKKLRKFISIILLKNISIIQIYATALCMIYA